MYEANIIFTVTFYISPSLSNGKLPAPAVLSEYKLPCSVSYKHMTYLFTENIVATEACMQNRIIITCIRKDHYY